MVRDGPDHRLEVGSRGAARRTELKPWSEVVDTLPLSTGTAKKKRLLALSRPYAERVTIVNVYLV